MKLFYIVHIVWLKQCVSNNFNELCIYCVINKIRLFYKRILIGSLKSRGKVNVFQLIIKCYLQITYL